MKIFKIALLLSGVLVSGVASAALKCSNGNLMEMSDPQKDPLTVSCLEISGASMNTLTGDEHTGVGTRKYNFTAQNATGSSYLQNLQTGKRYTCTFSKLAKICSGGINCSNGFSDYLFDSIFCQEN